jgi:hypothetical protein
LKDPGSAHVSGRVTCADQPFSGMIYFLPNDQGGLTAMGPITPDGSFELYVNGERDRPGAVPGTYRVVICPGGLDRMGPRVGSKYRDGRTTNLLVHVGADWNDFRFNLH